MSFAAFTQPSGVRSIVLGHGSIYYGLENGTVLQSLDNHHENSWQAHSAAVVGLKADNNFLFTTSHDGEIKIWNQKDRTLSRTIIGHKGKVTSICLTHDGRLYTGGADKQINEWDVTSGRRNWILTGSRGWILSLCSSPALPRRLFSADSDYTIKCWATNTGRLFTN
jgi:WD40 repeat protein